VVFGLTGALKQGWSELAPWVVLGLSVLIFSSDIVMMSGCTLTTLCSLA
jgi:hypothetical protein